VEVLLFLLVVVEVDKDSQLLQLQETMEVVVVEHLTNKVQLVLVLVDKDLQVDSKTLIMDVVVEVEELLKRVVNQHLHQTEVLHQVEVEMEVVALHLQYEQVHPYSMAVEVVEESTHYLLLLV
jgi:hypothetical protein